MRPVLLVPGINNSGPDHWQTLWERTHPGVRRVQQQDWDHPDGPAWAERLDQAIAEAGEPVVLVAHSLGCLVVVHWAARHAGAGGRVRAALLVAPPDPSGPAFPREATRFAPLPQQALPFETVVVSSSNDPYSSPQFTTACVAEWGAEHLALGALGHLNASSGLGDWPEGWAWVERLRGA